MSILKRGIGGAIGKIGTAVNRLGRKSKSAPGQRFRSALSYMSEFLKKPGCAVCEIVKHTTDKFYFWFLTEQYYHPPRMEQLQLSYGFCPEHTRPLRNGPVYVVAVTYEYILAHVNTKLLMAYESLNELPRTGMEKRKRVLEKVLATLNPQLPCPLCTEVQTSIDYELEALIDGWTDPEIREIYQRSDGLCLRHLARSLELAPGKTGKGLIDDALRRVRLRTGLEAKEILWGKVRDRQSMSEVGGAGSSPNPGPSDLLTLLCREGCPVCRAFNEGVSRFYSQLFGTASPLPESLEEIKRSLLFCPAHTWCLLECDQSRVIEEVCSTVLKEAIAKVSKITAASIEEENRPLNMQAGSCPACRWGENAARESLQLLLESLRDNETAARYRGSDGLCMRHFLQGLSVAVEIDASSTWPERILYQLLRDQCDRLRILLWELREFMRKYDWNYRYVPKGSEQTAWRRAVEQLAGSELQED